MRGRLVALLGRLVTPAWGTEVGRVYAAGAAWTTGSSSTNRQPGPPGRVGATRVLCCLHWRSASTVS